MEEIFSREQEISTRRGEIKSIIIKMFEDDEGYLIEIIDMSASPLSMPQKVSYRCWLSITAEKPTHDYLIEKNSLWQGDDVVNYNDVHEQVLNELWHQLKKDYDGPVIAKFEQPNKEIVKSL